MIHNKPSLVKGPSTSPNNTCNKKLQRYEQLLDNELLVLIGTNQDRAALTELYQRYQLPITRFLLRKLCSAKLVEEVYNDVMLVVWQKANTFRGDSKVSTWLHGIAYRTRHTHSRKENRHNHSGTDEFMSNVVAESHDETQVSGSDELHAALLDLSEAHRTVIELAYFHGYNTSEIARIVRVPQNTVKTRLFHARKKLKVILEASQAYKQNDTTSPLAAFATR